MGVDKQILLATQKNAADDDPAPDAIYEIGTIANVLQLLAAGRHRQGAGRGHGARQGFQVYGPRRLSRGLCCGSAGA